MSLFLLLKMFSNDDVFFSMQKVHEAMNKPGVSAKLRDVLRQLSSYDNVPRKKAKFQVGARGVVVAMYLEAFSKVLLCFVLCFASRTG